MLSDYSSLIEVITATYFTMCIDDVLQSIWTPEYHKKVTLLLDQINIPIAKNMRKDIEKHVNTFTADIKKHMKVKSVFMLIYCIFLLFLVGLESHFSLLKINNNETELIFRTSFLFLIFVCLGKYAFRKFSTLFWDFLIIGVSVLCLYAHDFCITGGELLTENKVLCFMLVVLLVPIAWQVFLCWVYSSLYYGYLKDKIKKEQILFDRAKQAYRIRQVAAAPVEYHDSVANDIERAVLSICLDSEVTAINKCFLNRMEGICSLPWSVQLLWSDIKYHFKRWRYPNEGYEEHDNNNKQIFKTAFLPKLDEHMSIGSVDNDTKYKNPNFGSIVKIAFGVMLSGIAIGFTRKLIKKMSE